MRNSARALVGLLVITLAGAAVLAQDSSVYVTLCHARFSVRDAQGRSLTTLTRNDIRVFDNDALVAIDEFVPHVNAPVSVAVVLDRSRSVGDRFGLLVAAAAQFSNTVLHDSGDRGLLVAFDSKAYLLQDWTGEPNALATGMRPLTAAGGTSVFDAVFKTCRDKFDPTDSRQNVLVLVTDGEDTTSRATFDQALQMANQARVTIYVIGVRSPDSMNPRELQGQQVLARLADLTGGRVFYPDGRAASSLGVAFAALNDELRNGYDVTYTLNVPPDSSFHRVRIEPTDRSLAVHGRRGYYAQRRWAP